MYMLPKGSAIRKHGISFHSYAKDTQLCVAMSSDDTGPTDSLLNCVVDVKVWTSQNVLLNQEKTEVLVIGSKARKERKKLASILNAHGLDPSQEARSLGVLFNSDFSFKLLVRSVTKRAFYHLKNIPKVFLSLSNTEHFPFSSY